MRNESDVRVPRDDASPPNRLKRPVILTPTVVNGSAAAFPNTPADVGTTSAVGWVRLQAEHRKGSSRAN